LSTGTADDSDIITNSSPDYNESQLKKLAIPIGVVSGVILGSAILYLIWRVCFKSKSTVS